MNFLGNLQHPNLVKLIGYCIEDDQRLLVYEFMPRGSLENHLFRSMRPFLPTALYLSLVIKSILIVNCFYLRTWTSFMGVPQSSVEMYLCGIRNMLYSLSANYIVTPFLVSLCTFDT